MLVKFTIYLTELVGPGGDASGWQLTGSLEAAKGGRPGMEQREESALNMFKSMDLKGRSGGGDDTKLRTVHQNTITSVRSYEYTANGNVTRVSTSGVDGKLVIWPVIVSTGVRSLR